MLFCGTVLPDWLDGLDHRHFFEPIHYLALHCDDTTRAERLRARPAWRGWNEARIAEHAEFARWFVDNAETAFSPPLSIVDTSAGTTLDTAKEVRDWALDRW